MLKRLFFVSIAVLLVTSSFLPQIVQASVSADSSTIYKPHKEVAPPDLTVTSVSFPLSSVEVGQTISVTFTVKNQGGSPSGPFHNRISLATTKWGTTYSLGNFAVGSLSAGESKSITITTNPIPSIPAGSYYVTVFTDGFKQVNEGNEGNNIGSSTPNKILIRGPVESVPPEKPEQDPAPPVIEEIQTIIETIWNIIEQIFNLFKPEPDQQPIDAPTLAPPTLSSPSHSSIVSTLTPVFRWTAAPGAESYGLYIRDLTTGRLVFDSQARGITITGTSFTLPSGILIDGRNYRWNMRPWNRAGWGGFSPAWEFRVEVPQPLGRIEIGIAGLSLAELSALGKGIDKVLVMERGGRLTREAAFRASALAGEAEVVGGLFTGFSGFLAKSLAELGLIEVQPPEHIITLPPEHELVIFGLSHLATELGGVFGPGGEICGSGWS
ncbi:hypothetical protein M1N44_03300 [Dehalococcoidia bacterium]|nr:hypothetical protein [Dehalococcoidia bacterium]